MERKETTLVIAFDLRQDGKSLFADDVLMRNALETSLGNITVESGPYIIDLRTSMYRFLQHLNITFAQDGILDRQIQGITQEAEHNKIYLEMPLQYCDFRDFRCGLSETYSIQSDRQLESIRLRMLDQTPLIPEKT